jgi:hypothetical protein
MKQSPLERRTPLSRRTPLARASELVRTTQLERSSTPTLRRTPLGHATPEQKAAVAGRSCIVCAGGPCDPAHLIDRAIAGPFGDDPRIVVALCRNHHDEYDDGDLDLSPYLEPRHREAVAVAVEAVGLFRALQRITGRRWVVADG